MRGAIPLLPQYALMVWCFVKHRDDFTFYFYPIYFGYILFLLTNLLYKGRSCGDLPRGNRKYRDILLALLFVYYNIYMTGIYLQPHPKTLERG
jgi:hypothetical protein